jgi:hypothetical protein
VIVGQYVQAFSGLGVPDSPGRLSACAIGSMIRSVLRGEVCRSRCRDRSVGREPRSPNGTLVSNEGPDPVPSHAISQHRIVI